MTVDVVEPANNSGGGGGGGSSGGAGVAIAAGVGVAALVVGYSWVAGGTGGGSDVLFDFTPSAEISYINGQNYYSYGSRFDFNKDNMNAYWSYGKTTNDLSIYKGGFSWSDEFLTIGLNSSVTDFDSSIISIDTSHSKEWGAWNASINLYNEWNFSKIDYIEGNTFKTGINLTGEYTDNNWRLIPSSGIGWNNKSNEYDYNIRLNIIKDFK